MRPYFAHSKNLAGGVTIASLSLPSTELKNKQRIFPAGRVLDFYNLIK